MIVGISVTMKVSFRQVQQEFSNVAHYQLPTAVTAPSQELLDDYVAFLKSIHSLDVTFVRGQVWSAGGTPQQNQMLLQQDLSGAGLTPISAAMDRERAVLIRWPAGVDVRGKPVYLRKWFHTCGGISTKGSWTNAELQNTAAIPAADRTAIANKCNEMKEIGTEFWQLCGPTGREPTGDAQCHEFLEHHQMGDMWR